MNVQLSDEERALMKHLLKLWRDRERLLDDMDAVSADFDRAHGEGSVKELHRRVSESVAKNLEQKAAEAALQQAIKQEEIYAEFLAAYAACRQVSPEPPTEGAE